MQHPLHFDILTLFPGIFEGFLSESVLHNALEADRIRIRLHNMRDWADDKHFTMDDRPFGGGPGMVLKVDRVVPSVEAVQQQQELPGRLLMMTPQGKVFNQRYAESLAVEKRIVLLCGRYEGFDERIIELLQPEEISLGDYILNGGEIAAMVVVETVMRLIPGILGDADSNRYDSFSSGNRLLDCAQYTRPREYRGLAVPEVLLNGHHAEITRWRNEDIRKRTAEKRPDLLEGKMSTILQDSPEVLQAYEEYKRFSSDPIMREKYRARERFLIDRQLDLTDAWERGLSEGEAKKALETARVMKQEDFEAAIIAEITGLPLSEIEQLD